MQILQNFKHNPKINTIFISKVNNQSIMDFVYIRWTVLIQPPCAPLWPVGGTQVSLANKLTLIKLKHYLNQVIYSKLI